MEEFKYLEGIIDLCRKELYNGDRNIHATLGFEELKELQNLLNKRSALERHAGILINKNKELEKMVEKFKNYSKSVYDDYANAVVELQEKNKMIELMSEYILNEYVSPEICSKHTPEDCYADIYDDNACRDCVIEFFRKKAKGE